MSEPVKQNVLDVIESAGAWLKSDETIALATVVDTWGSAPVPVGGQMLVGKDGKFLGSVSGGCVEAEVVAESEEILASGAKCKTLEYGIADETAWRVGLPCGGSIQVYLEKIDKKGPDAAVVERLLQARAKRQGLVLVTNMKTGARTVVADDEPVPAGPYAQAIEQAFANGDSRMIETSEGKAFVHAILPPPRVFVVGATHIGQVLAELCGMVDLDVTIIDPRTAFASSVRFPEHKLITEWPGAAIKDLGLDRYTAVVALAHVANIDDEGLEAALKAPCFYVGALGSGRNQQKRRERLTAKGFTPADLARIRGPIGVDIGAVTPAEIAVSIVAEIIGARRSKRRAAAKAAA
jgi:xanthine dehydrogenase accessory factor